MKISIKDLCALKNAGYTVEDISALTEMGVLENEDTLTSNPPLHSSPTPEVAEEVEQTSSEPTELEMENARLKEELAEIQKSNRENEVIEEPEVDLIELFK